MTDNDGWVSARAWAAAEILLGGTLGLYLGVLLALLCSCASQKQAHVEEHVSVEEHLDEHAEAEGAASSSETRTQEPTRVTTTTEFFQPVVDARPHRAVGPAPADHEDAGARNAGGNGPERPPVLIRRTVRIEERGKLIVEKQAEVTGKATESLSLDAGVRAGATLDTASKSGPAASCAAGGALWAVVIIVVVVGGLVLRFKSKA